MGSALARITGDAPPYLHAGRGSAVNKLLKIDHLRKRFVLLSNPIVYVQNFLEILSMLQCQTYIVEFNTAMSCHGALHS